MRALWAELGLRPILFWPYDVDGTASIFLSTGDARDGIQIDVLHDPFGRGRYGFRSKAMLDHVIPGEMFPRLDPETTRTYLARKRMVKGQAERFRQLTDHSGGLPLADEILSPRAAAAVKSAVGAANVRARRFVKLQPGRWGRRLRRPIGAWVHVGGGPASTSTALGVARRLERFIPHVRVGPLPPVWRRPLWWAWHVAPIRWRPGVFVSHDSDESMTPRQCDVLVMEADNIDHACQQIVDALANRSVR